MDEEKARKILGTWIQSNGSLHGGAPWLVWKVGKSHAELDGDFDASELEAIVWWIRNKGK